MAADHAVAGLAVMVSLATPAGRSRRYSLAKPLAGSLDNAFQPPPRVKVWPGTPLLNPSAVMTSSPLCAIAPAVETVRLPESTLVALPVWSRGAAVATPDHSVIWASQLMFAGLIVKVALAIPPGLLG